MSDLILVSLDKGTGGHVSFDQELAPGSVSSLKEVFTRLAIIAMEAEQKGKRIERCVFCSKNGGQVYFESRKDCVTVNVGI